MLRLVLPKGSLERATMQLFEDADLAVVRGSDVDYRGSIDDPRVDEVRILRPQEIPRYVADGMFDVGITGRDWIEERHADVVTLTELHYSKATARPIRVVLAVAADSSAQSVTDLPSGLVVHTEYPELTARYFELRHYGRLYGVFFGTFTLGLGLSPVLISRMQQASGSYHLALWASCSVLIVGAISMVSLPRFGSTHEPAH